MARYAKVPIEALTDSRLNPRLLRVLLSLLMFADKDGRCHPTSSQISSLSGIREKDIAVFTSQLAKLGWVTKTGNGGRSSPADYVVETPLISGGDYDEETTPKSGNKPPLNPGKTTPKSGGGIQQTNQQTINRPLKDCSTPSGDAAPPAKKSALSDEMKTAYSLTWDSYSKAYAGRYGITPVKNAKVAGQVVAFVKRLPMDEAPHIAAHYLTSSARWYVTVGHSVDAMLKDAEKLRMEWATNRRITSESARQADANQSNANAAAQAKAILANRRASL